MIRKRLLMMTRGLFLIILTSMLIARHLIFGGHCLATSMIDQIKCTLLLLFLVRIYIQMYIKMLTDRVGYFERRSFFDERRTNEDF